LFDSTDDAGSIALEVAVDGVDLADGNPHGCLDFGFDLGLW
jgi:hypothetical protein